MAWKYEREESKSFTIIPEGEYRVRVKSAEMAVSKNGNDMLTIQLEVSGQTGLLFHHITFLQDRPEITNRMLTQFFDSFKDIKEGDQNFENWIGKVGACAVKHDEYNGNKSAKVWYFIAADKQGELPAWKEPERKDATDGFVDVPEVDEKNLPF